MFGLRAVLRTVAMFGVGMTGAAQGAEAAIHFGAHDTELRTIEIESKNSAALGGFQIGIAGLKLSDAYGGRAEKAGFLIENSSNLVLSFSISGDSIDAGAGTLVVVEYASLNDREVCFIEDTTVFSDTRAQELKVDLGDCLSVGNCDLELELGRLPREVPAGGSFEINGSLFNPCRGDLTFDGVRLKATGPAEADMPIYDGATIVVEPLKELKSSFTVRVPAVAPAGRYEAKVVVLREDRPVTESHFSIVVK